MTDQPPMPVNWQHANGQSALSILDCVALSVGFDIGELPPLGGRFTDRPTPPEPPEFRERVIATYSAAQAGKLRMTGVSALEDKDRRSLPADVRDPFNDAQYWEIDLVEFRQFCKSRGWAVPLEFHPFGYVVEERVGASGVHAKTDADEFSMTKSAMLKEFLGSWPTIENDLNNASRNGLDKAKSGKRKWSRAKAEQWAIANAKMSVSSQAPRVASSVWPHGVVRHKLD